MQRNKLIKIEREEKTIDQETHDEIEQKSEWGENLNCSTSALAIDRARENSTESRLCVVCALGMISISCILGGQTWDFKFLALGYITMRNVDFQLHAINITWLSRLSFQSHLIEPLDISLGRVFNEST